jgi:YidC/Oxa1 family membrane protein insertase
MEQRQSMDRSSVIGIILIVIIFLGYMWLSTPSREQLAAQKQTQDSIAMVNERAQKAAIKPSVADTTKTVINDSAVAGSLAAMLVGKEEKFYTLENSELKLVISSKGGRVHTAMLKNYKKAGMKEQVTLLDGKNSVFEYSFTTADNKNLSSSQLEFVPQAGAANGTLVMRSQLNDGQYLEHSYALPKEGFALKMNLKLKGMEKIISRDYLDLNWKTDLIRQEAHITNERDVATIYYRNAGENVETDDLGERKDASEKITTELKWIAFKQQYFNISLVADKSFANGSQLETKSVEPSDSQHVKTLSAQLSIPYTKTNEENFGMQWIFAPNYYEKLEAMNLNLESMIPLGWGIFGWVNRWVVIPIFNALDDFNLGYGLIILLLTLIIKTALFPLVFRSFRSTAKMRVLKPEVDEIKARYEKDFQKQQSETMNLYRKAGVNPMGGCLPMLLQLPILFAMFRFFPAAFELRQQPFLWADDLSTYDSIYNLPFEIPFYGDHVSLFTILMTITSLVFTWFNNQQSGITGPMKNIGYIMPVIFLGVFNRYAAGLSYYYFISTAITIIQQYAIGRLIDKDALHAQLQENKKKPLKKSRFQQRLEEMAKQRGIDPNKPRR